MLPLVCSYPTVHTLCHVPLTLDSSLCILKTVSCAPGTHKQKKKKKRLSPILFCKCKLFQNPIWFLILFLIFFYRFPQHSHYLHWFLCSVLKSMTLSPSQPPNFKCQTTFDTAAWQRRLANPGDGPWHEGQWSHLVNESLCWQTPGEGVEEGLGEGVYCIRYTGAYTLFYIHMVHDHTRWQTK